MSENENECNSIYKEIKTFRINIEVGKTKKVHMFFDKEIILEGEIEWDTNFRIQKIILKLENRGKNSYKICYASRCVDNYECFPDYVLMQLSRSENGAFEKYSEFPLDLSGNEIDFTKSYKRGGPEFLFNVTNSERCLNGYTCFFNDGIPRTKDGTIIVGG